jgi:hypothetical protein
MISPQRYWKMIPTAVLEDAAQLVKANSNTGSKIKKNPTGGMDVCLL